MPYQVNRRQLLQQMTVLSVISALPATALAQIISNPAPKSRFNSNSTAEDVTEGLDLRGQTIAITGANSGLGFETMRVLTMRGAHVIAIARTQAKAEKACSNVIGETTPLFLDLAKWESVVKCANQIRRLGSHLDGLICNAGVMAIPELRLVNGVERQFAINHLGHFILINQLLEEVKAAPEGRFTILSSRAHRRARNGIEFDNLDGSQHYGPWEAYGVSKLANALCSKQLALRLSDSNATANSLHPGVINTQLVKNLPTWQQWAAKHLGWIFMKDIHEGAATTCYVATSPGLKGVRGLYFSDSNVADDGGYLLDDAMAAKLWTVSEELTKNYLPKSANNLSRNYRPNDPQLEPSLHGL